MHLFISFLFLFLSAQDLHEFHLSNTEVRYNQEEQSLQITTRIFIDDLEEALAKSGHENLFLCTDREAPIADGLLQEYIFEHINLTVDGVHRPYAYLGKEISDDLIAVWCYLEIENVSLTNSIEVENTVLLDDFDDQKNIVRIKTDAGAKTMFILENGDYTGIFKL